MIKLERIAQAVAGALNKATDESVTATHQGGGTILIQKTPKVIAKMGVGKVGRTKRTPSIDRNPGRVSRITTRAANVPRTRRLVDPATNSASDQQKISTASAAAEELKLGDWKTPLVEKTKDLMAKAVAISIKKEFGKR